MQRENVVERCVRRYISLSKQPTYNITKARAQLTRNLIRPDYPGFGF